MDLFQMLPLEIIENILLELSVKELLNCTLVSKSWRSSVNLDFVWKYHCQRQCFVITNINKFEPEFLDDDHQIPTNLEPLCLWRKIYSWHINLRNNWTGRKFERHTMAAENCGSPVFCIDSDGKVAVSGHADSSINIWDVAGVPSLQGTLFGMLGSVPVVSVRIWNCYIVVLQKKLLQIYKKDESNGFILVNAKTFELSDEKMTLMDKVYILGEKFDYWYKECLRVTENSQFALRRLVFTVYEDLFLASVGGSAEVGVWKISGGSQTSLTGFSCIRSIISNGQNVYIVSGEGNTLISEYSKAKNDTKVILTIPGWKKIVITDEYIIAIPNRMDTSLKRIWVWDRKYTLLRTRKLGFGHISAAPVSHLIVYSENSLVTVWDPRFDTILSTFSAGSTIAFIKPAFSTLMVTFMNTSVHVWDFIEGKRLYRIYSELEWLGDFRDQLWINPCMIIAGGINKQIELLSFLKK